MADKAWDIHRCSSKQCYMTLGLGARYCNGMEQKKQILFVIHLFEICGTCSIRFPKKIDERSETFTSS